MVGWDGLWLPPVERLAIWPAEDEAGQFVIRCSCARWHFTGTATAIRAQARAHDDSPYMNHLVSIYGRLAKGDMVTATGKAH